VYLRAGSSADLAVIPGDYEMMFSVGTVWCSLESGFKDGDRSKLNQRFSLSPEQPLVLELQSTGSQASAFGVFVRNQTPPAPVVPPAVQILGDGEMRLQRAQDGHYYMQGSVSGRPVDFLVDTGASFTTLKQDVAQAGGIQNCQATQSKTANGIVDVCIGIIPEIRIGAYIVRNAVVVANPKTEANLLGMNVLGQFQIRTENDVMTLTRP
jgi:aspartyl protease family protein